MRKYLLLFAGVLFSFVSLSQDFSNKGKEFWLAYSYHVGMVNGGPPVVMTLYVTSDVATTYNVDVYGGVIIQSGNILPNQVVSIIIPNTYFINDEGVFTNRAIHVTAAKPIVVYSFITRSQASAATLALPLNVLGKQYIAMSFTQVSNEQNSNSFLTIVAVEDNTTVEIIPTVATKGGWAANSVNVISLNKGEIYQVLGTTSGGNGVDLSGSSIRSISSGTASCKKIAVFSGSGKVSIGCTGSSDNLYQQLYPVGSWGKKYLTAPSYNQPNNFYRVLKSVPLANVFVNGVLIPSTSFTNGYYEFFNNRPNLIEGDLPISVTQYFTTQGCSGNSSPNDPDMIELNPVEQNINNVTLISSNLTVSGAHEHHLHIIMKNTGAGTTAFTSFKFDNIPVPVSSWITHPSEPNYSYLYLPNVTETSHSLSSDSGFNALAYGYGNAESYGYSAGTNVRDLYIKAGVSSLYGIETTASVCVGEPFKFKISLPYLADSIKWDFGSAPNPAGIIVYYPPFMPDSTTTVSGKPIYWYSTPGTYNYSTANTYPFTITTYSQNTDGCGNIQELSFDLSVSDPPVGGFTNTTPGCVAEQVQFTDNTITVKPTYKWSWNFGDPASGASNTSSVKNPVHLFSAPGTYWVTYSNITTPGCLSDTVRKQIIIPALPTATISGSTILCLNDVSPNITFTGAKGTAPYTFTYTINSGSGPGPVQTIASATGNSVTLPIPTNIAATYIYTLTGVQNTGSALCIQPQSGSATVKINSLPTATISGTTSVCLNALSPKIIFTGAAGTAPYTFTYNIDKGSGAGPNQTITTVSGNLISIPVATNGAGVFKYSLLSVKDASPTLCSQPQSGSSTITVNPLPSATISGSTELCTNATLPVITFTGAGGTSPYSFTYNINGGSNQIVKTTGGNTITVIVPTNTSGSLTYKLISVTDASTAMCSQAQTGIAIIKINPLPVAAFNTTVPSCETRVINFTDMSVPNAGNINSWSWNFGDPSSGVANTSSLKSPAHNFTSAGNYIITLQVTTDKGCVSVSPPKTITINSRPKASFIVPEVCLLDPFAQFTDTSKIAGPSAVTAWEWDFGDAANSTAGNPNTSTVQNAKHKYIFVGNYTVRLIAISNNGCRDTIFEPLTINGGNPIADFDSLNATANCANDSIAIQNKSNISSGNITRLEIFWDNSNAPAISQIDETPVANRIYKHKYADFQTPLVKLVNVRVRAYSGGICFSDITKSLSINASPKILFNNLPNGCIDATPFIITQASEVSGLPGSGVYTGPGVIMTSPGIYNFSPALAGSGTHSIKYTFTSATGSCVSADSTKITVYKSPTVNAGPDEAILQGGSITLQPIVSGSSLQYLWSWNNNILTGGLNNSKIKNPLASPIEDIIYTLTVTGTGGCTAADDILIKVLLAPKIPNTFSPNNDGINDFWEIKYLDTYPGNRVQVFTRTGKLVFESRGYKKPWDGNINGLSLPVDTYYYIIEPGNGRKPITGYVTIIK
ncbi:MAG: PKD domain-containing protein [Ferruginibacter sp.]